MKKIVRLSESDLVRLVNRVILEQNGSMVSNKMGEIESLLNQYRYKQVNMIPKSFSVMPFEEPYMGTDYPSGFSNKLPPIWVNPVKGEPSLVYLMKKNVKSNPQLVVSVLGQRNIFNVLKSSIADIENALRDPLLGV